MKTRLTDALVTAFAISIAAATLYDTQSPPWVVGPKIRIGVDIADLIRNVAFFAPLGFALALRGLAARRAIGGIALFSLAIELAQLMIVSRTTSPWDVVGNTLGGAVGFAVTANWRSWALAPAPTARLLCAAAAILASGAFWATAWAVAPSVPVDRTYAHLPTGNPNYARFSGGDLVAMLDGERLPRNRIPDPEPVRAALIGQSFELKVSAVLGPRPDGPMNFFMISTGDTERVLSLVPDRDDMLFLYRIRAATVGLEDAVFRVRGLLEGAREGDRLSVRVRRTGAEVCIDTGATPHCGVGFRAGDGWALLLPLFVSDLIPPALLGWAWMTALFLPIGFWQRPGPLGWISLAVAAVAALSAPWTGPVMPMSAGQALAGVLAWAAGRGLGRALNPPEPRSGTD